MEKFSAFRDPPTGIAPFVVPVPPSASTPTALYPLYPLLALLSLARSLLVLVILVLAWLISSLLLPLKWTHLTNMYNTIDAAHTSLLLRLALGLLGYPWVSQELSSLKRGFASASRSMELPLKPVQGDLITANWSSYIDVLYLAFRYNPAFVVPLVNKHDDALVGFRSVGWLYMLCHTAHLPIVLQAPPTKSDRLQDILHAESRPCCLFPEFTTTNNRAVLQLPSDMAQSDLCRIPEKTRLFVLSFKHELPSLLQSTPTMPIPSLAAPLTHMLRLCLWPAPRSLQVRLLHSNERPVNWVGVQDAIAQLSKFKVIRGLSWKDKRRFLAYRKNAAH